MAVFGHDDPVALLLHQKLDRHHDAGLIIHYENFFWHKFRFGQLHPNDAISCLALHSGKKERRYWLLDSGHRISRNAQIAKSRNIPHPACRGEALKERRLETSIQNCAVYPMTFMKAT
jgi:hypothetical protein